MLGDRLNLNQLNRVLLQALLLPVIALGVVSGALAWQLLDAKRAVARIQLADTNIATATLISALTLDEETGLRAYQITSNEIFLQPYDFAAEPFATNMAKLHDGLRNQDANTRLLDTYAAEHAHWVRSIAEPIIATVQASQGTSDPGLNLRAKAQMDAMRLVLARIIADQHGRRTRAVDHWERELRHTIEALLGSALVLGLLIGVFARNRLHKVSHAFQEALGALRQHAQATHESEQRLRAILVSLGEAVVVCDLDGSVELMNAAAEKLSGWTEPEARRQPLQTVFPLLGETSQEPPEPAFLAIRREPQVHVAPEPLLLRRRDGSELTVEETSGPVYERNGALAGVALVLRDVTQQRRTQSALLSSEKLAVAGRLAATIAHEIHNPLDSVANLLFLMKTGDSAEENAEFLDLAQSELNRATQISRALLGMYRESRTAVALDLSSLLRSVLVLLEHKFQQANVSIETHWEEPSVVTGFPVELRQVFTNLLANAAEASPRGSTVTVRTMAALGMEYADHTGAQGPGIVVSISDCGQGIAPDVQEKLFQPFFSTKGEAGTGLGLWVSKGIVSKHGGAIELSSDSGASHHGTTISVFLPRGEAAWSEPVLEPELATVSFAPSRTDRTRTYS